jgi:hypothetical protein
MSFEDLVEIRIRRAHCTLCPVCSVDQLPTYRMLVTAA